MTPEDHEDYAADLLSSIRTDSPETDALDFIPNPRQTRNAAKAMAVILCRRVTMNSKHRPLLRKNTTYEWKQGVFNCRNIADRGYFWTNFRQRFAGEIHDAAGSQPVAFLLACCEPADTRMNIWAIPEPLLHGALANLPVKESDGDYTVQISTDRQRIEGYAGSPDLAPYYSRFELKGDEMLLLEAAQDADVLAKLERKTRSKTRRLLTAAEHELDEAGEFDPKGVVDARERVLSSIVKRRGQPAFRQHLLAAYNGRCAITGCGVADVLDAAHIVSYRGPDTNHPANGLLLRTDLHTLFDLKLVAVDVETMTVLVSPDLSATSYEKYRGKPISVPDNRESRPSSEALRRHRQESGL
jgi:hypothetical protein